MIRILSFGGGIQTSYMLFKYPERYDFCVFADVSKGTKFDEKAKTYWFIKNYVEPFCKENNIEYVEVHPKRPLFKHSIIRKIIPTSRFRWCTKDFKIRPINKFIRSLGATKKEPVHQDIGFSYDEYWRAGNFKDMNYVSTEFPLVDEKVTRIQCEKYLMDRLGFLPPKSSCVYCPYEKKSQLRQNAHDEPLKVPTIVFMEKNNSSYPKVTLVTRYHTVGGKRKLKGVPIETIMGTDSQSLDSFTDDDGPIGCETGRCFV